MSVHTLGYIKNSSLWRNKLISLCQRAKNPVCKGQRQSTSCLTFLYYWMGVSSVHKPPVLKRKESRSGFEPEPVSLPAECLTTRPNATVEKQMEYIRFSTKRTKRITVSCQQIIVFNNNNNYYILEDLKKNNREFIQRFRSLNALYKYTIHTGII